MKQPSTFLQEPAHSTLRSSILPAFRDELTKQKIHRHLNDINDVITEEDIRNIDTSITLKKATSTLPA